MPDVEGAPAFLLALFLSSAITMEAEKLEAEAVEGLIGIELGLSLGSIFRLLRGGVFKNRFQ